jgi:hypothetical protein
MRDVFPAHYPLARFVVACSIALGDLRVAVEYAVRDEQPVHERIYFVRLLIAHMRETVKLIALEHDKREDVQDFVKTLPTEAQDALEEIAKEADPDREGSLFADLKRVRDDAFHYPREGEDEGRLKDTLREVSNFEGVYRLDGDCMRADYADLVVVNAMHPQHEDEDETLKLARDLPQRMVDLTTPVSTFLLYVAGAWLA